VPPTARSTALPQAYPGLWYALNLSLLWPGLGHFYAGHRRRGAVWAIGMVGLLAIVLYSFLGPTGNSSVGAGALGIGILLWAVAVFDGLACYRPYRPGVLPPAIAKDAWYAVLLSHCWPGLGQIYRQQLGPGTAWLVASGLLWLLAARWPLVWLPACCLAVLPCYQLSPGRQRQSFAIALLICRLTIGAFPLLLDQVIEPFGVPSESMAPTLLVGDRLLVLKLPQYQPQVGDLIVFHSPEKQGQYFVKRVIGLAGDRIQIQAGQLQRNGQTIDEPYLREPIAYDLPPQAIASDRLFVLGDNRNQSYDSHIWGSLDRAKVIGRVYRISWPPERDRSI
jgi:signal peptidase I